MERTEASELWKRQQMHMTDGQTDRQTCPIVADYEPQANRSQKSIREYGVKSR